MIAEALTNEAFHLKGFYSVIIMGSLWEFGSYATRTISTRNQQNSGLALISQILILLAPICKLHLVSLYERAILTPASY